MPEKAVVLGCMWLAVAAIGFRNSKDGTLVGIPATICTFVILYFF
jgi:hypothetical protein